MLVASVTSWHYIIMILINNYLKSQKRNKNSIQIKLTLRLCSVFEYMYSTSISNSERNKNMETARAANRDGSKYPMKEANKTINGACYSATTKVCIYIHVYIYVVMHTSGAPIPMTLSHRMRIWSTSKKPTNPSCIQGKAIYSIHIQYNNTNGLLSGTLCAQRCTEEWDAIHAVHAVQ